MNTLPILRIERGADRYRPSSAESGAVLVEATLALPIFFTMIFLFFFLSLYLFADFVTDFATYRGIKLGLKSSVASPVENITNSIISQAQAFGVTVAPADIELCPLVDPACTTPSVGHQGEFFVVRVTARTFWGTSHESEAIGSNV